MSIMEQIEHILMEYTSLVCYINKYIGIKLISPAIDGDSIISESGDWFPISLKDIDVAFHVDCGEILISKVGTPNYQIHAKLFDECIEDDPKISVYETTCGNMRIFIDGQHRYGVYYEPMIEYTPCTCRSHS